MVYPFKKYNYQLVVDGVVVGGFSEVSAPEVSCESIEYRPGTHATAPTKMPGLIKYGNVTLKWGTANDPALLAWVQQAETGMAERKPVAIHLINDDQKVLASWQLANAWPVKYSAPDPNALGGEVPIESLELATEGLTRVI